MILYNLLLSNCLCYQVYECRVTISDYIDFTLDAFHFAADMCNVHSVTLHYLILAAFAFKNGYFMQRF